MSLRFFLSKCRFKPNSINIFAINLLAEIFLRNNLLFGADYRFEVANTQILRHIKKYFAKSSSRKVNEVQIAFNSNTSTLYALYLNCYGTTFRDLQ